MIVTLSSGHPQTLLSVDSMGALTSREFPPFDYGEALARRQAAMLPVE
jgi:hypothetical protein